MCQLLHFGIIFLAPNVSAYCNEPFHLWQVTDVTKGQCYILLFRLTVLGLIFTLFFLVEIKKELLLVTSRDSTAQEQPAADHASAQGKLQQGIHTSTCGHETIFG